MTGVGFEELGHFDKHFVKKKQEKETHKETYF